MTPTVFALTIEDPKTGYVSVRTYPDAFSRALELIALSSQPLILKTQDY